MREILTATLLLACCGHTQSQANETEPDPPRQAQTAMNTSHTHSAITLQTPYFPWQDAYARVRATESLGGFLDEKAIPALEAEGPPSTRLKNASAAFQEARLVLASQGQVDFTHDGLDTVEVDLKVCFFRDLAAAIARRTDQPPEARREGLIELRSLVEGPDGLPAPDERRAFTQTARITAQTMIDVHLEALE